MKRKHELNVGAGAPWFGAEKRIVSIVGRGSQAFLWIGNDDPSDEACFGMLDHENLRKLRDAITQVLRG